MLVHLRQPPRLFRVLLLSELLLSLQVPNSIRRLLVFLSQLYDPVLYLGLLVVHFLRQNNRVHHHVLVLLPSHRTHTLMHKLVLILNLIEIALESGVHSRTHVSRAVHNIITFFYFYFICSTQKSFKHLFIS